LATLKSTEDNELEVLPQGLWTNIIRKKKLNQKQNKETESRGSAVPLKKEGYPLKLAELLS
jgi:hypothetical protein